MIHGDKQVMEKDLKKIGAHNERQLICREIVDLMREAHTDSSAGPCELLGRLYDRIRARDRNLLEEYDNPNDS